MRIFTLNTPVRTIGDPEYTDFVDMLGEDWSGKRQALHLINQIGSIADAVDFLFPPHVLLDPMTCIQRAFLSPRNILVDEFNDIMLEALPGDFGALRPVRRIACLASLSSLRGAPGQSSENSFISDRHTRSRSTDVKLQGLTLQKAVLDLHMDSFAHGQLYTTLSRVRCRRDIRALFAETEDEETTANVVYKHLLL